MIFENCFKEMRCLTLLAITFMIYARFELFVCFENIDDDRRFKEELVDFAGYLKQKLEKQKPSPNSYFDPPVSIKDSAGDYLDDYVKDGKKRDDSDIESLLEDMVRNHPNDNLRDSDKTSSPRERGSSAVFSHPGKPTLDAPAKRHHGVKEIVFIRESESESNDPIPDMIEKLVNDQPAEYPTHEDPQHAPEEASAANNANAISPSEGTCSTKHLTSYIDQTCADGPQYEMEFHSEFSETLKSQMEDMLPINNTERSKCDFSRPLGPETGVEDRALCPFKRIVGSRNPSRIPEYLYEAKCSCQVWRPWPSKRIQFNCTEVKRAIPVLWLVSCEDGKKRYKQGWDEIAVACAPVEERPSDPLSEYSSD